MHTNRQCIARVIVEQPVVRLDRSLPSIWLQIPTHFYFFKTFPKVEAITGWVSLDPKTWWSHNRSAQCTALVVCSSIVSHMIAVCALCGVCV